MTGHALHCHEVQSTAGLFAAPADATGVGAHSDKDVRDEFHWAAAELFITTGEDAYRQTVLRSPLHADADALFPRDGMSRQSVAGLGALDLATVHDLTGRPCHRDAVLHGVDHLLAASVQPVLRHRVRRT